MPVPRFDTFPAIRWITNHGDRPSFSPDGARVVFHVQQGDANIYSLWIVNSDGTDLHLLYPPAGTKNPNASRPDWSWSERIAFGNNGEIWTIHPDGTDAAPYYHGRVAPIQGMTYPSWYKDLQAIAAVRYWDGINQAEIYKLTPMTQEQLTTSPNPCAGRPSVNPEGTKIAFAGNQGQCSQWQNQIWVVEPPNEPYRIEPGNPAAMQGRSPNWSPRGDLIVFESTRPAPNPQTTDPLALFVMKSDGSDARQLTMQTAVHAQWSRQQDRIVFASPWGIGIMEWETD